MDVVFNDLENSIKRIVSNFKHNVIRFKRISYIHRAKKISQKTASYIKRYPALIQKCHHGFINISGSKYIPLKVIEEKKSTSIDIYENRFVKYMIKRIINRLTLIETILKNEKQLKHVYIDVIIKRRKILNTYLKSYFQNISNLSGKKSMSLVFQMAPGYKEMFKKYSLLNKCLDLGDDLFQITPKKLYSLYEIWCYIKIHKILIDLGYHVQEYGIINYKDTGLYVNLFQDSKARMVYKNGKNTLELFYNKHYYSPTTCQRPDCVLYIRNISNKNRMYLFDAKYRLSIDINGETGPVEQDINAMHRYRDAIVSEIQSDFRYKHDTFGAYIMFPYADENRFVDHKFYKSIDQVNVGAFPMLPGSTKLITKHLKEILLQTELEAKNKRIIQDEFDDYARFKLLNVMVVNVKDKKHLHAYLKYKFYHIPASELSHIRIGIEYIAFYQSKSSFGIDSGIRYYSKIQQYKKYLRKNCKELPASSNNKDDTYLRFDLSDIIEISLVKPIQSGTRNISYTTLYLLKNAENMHELKLNSNLEIELYKILKSTGLSIRKEYGKYILNNNTIDIIHGKVIRLNGKITNLSGIKRNLLQNF